MKDSDDGARRAERWRQIRAEWEAGATVAGLARKYEISEKQIRFRKRTDGWAAPKRPSNLVSLDSRRRRPKGPTLPPIDNDVTDDELARSLRRVAKRVLDDLEGGRIEPGREQSVADVVARAVDAAAKAIDKSRDVAGRTKGQPSGAEAGEGKSAKIIWDDTDATDEVA